MREKCSAARPVLNLDLRILALPLLLGLVMVGPLLRGLFFPADRMGFHMVSALLFLMVYLDKLNRREASFFVSAVDYWVLALAACYGLSWCVSVDKMAGLYEVFNYANYFMLYWVAARLSCERTYAVRLLRALFASGVLVSVLGLAVALELVSFPGVSGAGRLASTFQYPNALASYAMAAGILGLGLWAQERAWLGRFVYGVGNYIFIIVILATLSRGVWLLYPAGVVLLAIGWQREQRWRMGFSYLWGLAVAIAVVQRLFPAMQALERRASVTYLALGILGILAGELVYVWAARWLDGIQLHRNMRRALQVGIVIYCVLVVCFYVGYTVRAHVLPLDALFTTRVMARAGTISVDTPSAFVRMQASGDAMRVVSTSPIVGHGGGGWDALYHQHQNMLYWMSEVHNHFAQLWVEVGTLGFAVYMGFWVSLVMIGWRLWRSRSEAFSWAWVPLSTVLIYGAHSAIEFQLSLPGAALLLWVAAGCLAGMARSEGVLEPPVVAGDLLKWSRLPQTVLVTGLVLFMVIVPLRIDAAGRMANAGAFYVRQHDFQHARTYYQEASRLNPYSGVYHGELAYINTVLGVLRRSSDEHRRAEYHLRQMQELQPNKLSLAMRLCEIYRIRGDFDRAIAAHQRLTQLVPLDIRMYESYASSVVNYLPHLVSQGNYEASRSWLEQLVELEPQLRETKENIPPEVLPYWRRGRLDITPLLELRVAQAYVLLGEWELGEKRLSELVENEQLAAEARVYLASVYVRTNQADELNALLAKMDQEQLTTVKEILNGQAAIQEATQ